MLGSPRNLWSKIAFTSLLDKLGTISAVINFCRLLWTGRMSKYETSFSDISGSYYTPSYQDRITNQLRRLGGSYDWGRTAFTMDEASMHFIHRCPIIKSSFQGLSRAVIETFCRLREDGIIYRANRLVNWCVKMNTTLSNLEVRTILTLIRVPLPLCIGGGKSLKWPHVVERSGI